MLAPCGVEFTRTITFTTSGVTGTGSTGFTATPASTLGATTGSLGGGDSTGFSASGVGSTTAASAAFFFPGPSMKYQPAPAPPSSSTALTMSAILPPLPPCGTVIDCDAACGITNGTCAGGTPIGGGG